MVPQRMSSEVQIEVNDSCNNCCCWPTRRAILTRKKVNQTPKVQSTTVKAQQEADVVFLQQVPSETNELEDLKRQLADARAELQRRPVREDTSKVHLEMPEIK